MTMAQILFIMWGIGAILSVLVLQRKKAFSVLDALVMAATWPLWWYLAFMNWCMLYDQICSISNILIDAAAKEKEANDARPEE